MPARPPRPNLRLPEMLTEFRRLPQRKVPRALFFITVVVHSRARLNAGQINLRKFPVSGKFRNPVINRSFALIRERLLLQPLNQLHHILDMVRSPNPVLRRLDAQCLAIRKKRRHILLGILPNPHSRRRRIGDDPVIHVGQVHRMSELQSALFQVAPQNILKHERAKISDVRIVVYGRPARVHLHFARTQRHEFFYLPAQRVVQSKFVHDHRLAFFVQNEPQIVADPHKNPQCAARLAFSHSKHLRRASTGKRQANHKVT